MTFYRCIALALLISLSAFSGKSMAGDPIRLVKGQTVYVPAYSHIYSGNNEQRFLLAVTLSIRNTDSRTPITILSAKYCDTTGKLLRECLPESIVLERLASTRHVIKESDKTGGSGASFLVQWKSESPVNPPIIETVMIGTQSQQGISFTSRGQVIQEDP